MTVTDIPADLLQGLVARLRTIFRQDGDAFCIVAWDEHYVQYLGRANYENLWFEAVSDFWLAKQGRTLAPGQRDVLDGLGFLPPGTASLNYTKFLAIADEGDLEAAAQFGLMILRDAFGWRGQPITIECPLYWEDGASLLEDRDASGTRQAVGGADDWVMRAITTPQLDLVRFFSLKSDMPTLSPVVHLRQAGHGIVDLTLAVGDQAVEICISFGCANFEPLVEWAKRVEREGSVSTHIYQDGPAKILSVLATDDPGRVLLLLQEEDHETVDLQGVVSRADLVAAWRQELGRFFRGEFSPTAWALGDPAPAIAFHQALLADSWLTCGPDVLSRDPAQVDCLAPDRHDQRLAVQFLAPEHGWLDARISPLCDGWHLSATAVRAGTFPALLTWLEGLLAGVPGTWTMDGEGLVTQFSVLPETQTLMFTVPARLVAVQSSSLGRVGIRQMRVQVAEVVAAFYTAFRDMATTSHYDPEHWDAGWEAGDLRMLRSPVIEAALP